MDDFDAAIIYAAGFVAAQGAPQIAHDLLGTCGINPMGNHSGAAEYDLDMLRKYVAGWDGYVTPNAELRPQAGQFPPVAP